MSALTVYRCPVVDCGWGLQVDREWHLLLRTDAERDRARAKISARVREHEQQHDPNGCRACRRPLTARHVEGCPIGDGFVWREHLAAGVA